MSVKINVVKRGQPGINGGGTFKYYAQVASRKKIPTEQLCLKIEKSSALTDAEVYGVILQFVHLIPELLLEGYAVELDQLGIFSLHVRSEGNTDPYKVSGDNIREARIHFRPSVRLKKRLKSATYKIVQRKI